MTIGMLVESLASKAGALNGKVVDATPFQKSDGKPVRWFLFQMDICVMQSLPSQNPARPLIATKTGAGQHGHARCAVQV